MPYATEMPISTVNAGGNSNTTYREQKSVILGVILAAILPGAGHIYGGKIITGIFIFFVSFILLLMVITIPFSIFIFGLPAFILWIGNIISARKTIISYNCS